MKKLLLIFVISLSSLMLDTQAAWFNGDWLYRHQITVKASEVDGDLYDFPVLVELEDMPNRFYSKVKSDGGDIRMTSSDEVTELPIELVYFSKAKKRGELYFKAPFIDNGSDTDFYLYYGNSSANLYSDTDDYGAENVWTNGTIAIYQMNSNPANGVLDSAGFQDLTENGNMNNSDSKKNKLGTSLDFDGSNDEAFFQTGDRRKVFIPKAYLFNGMTSNFISFTDRDEFSFTDGSGNDRPFSITAWLKPIGATSGTILAKNTTGDPAQGEFYLIYDNTGIIYIRTEDLSNSARQGIRSNTGALNINQWNHITATYDGSGNPSGYKIYLNGRETTQVDSSAGVYNGMENTSAPLTIGKRGDTAPTFASTARMKDIRLYSRELTKDDAYKIYASGRIIHTEDLVLHIKAEDTNLDTAYDASGNNYHGVKNNIDLNLFHGTDPTTPISFSNEVGYSSGKNMLIYSEEFDQNLSTQWALSTTFGTPPTVDANVALAPDGNMTADRINFTTSAATNQDRLVQQQDDNILSGTYTFSVYARNDSGPTDLRLLAYEISGSPGSTFTDFTLTNSWQRYSITRTFENGDASVQNFQIRSGSDSTNSFFIWGAQLEPGDTATDYQKTGAYSANGDIIPRNESNITQDIFGNNLEYSGKVPHHAYPTRSTAAYFNGASTSFKIETTAFPEWDLTNNGITVITNLEADSFGASDRIFRKGSFGPATGFILDLTASGNLRAYIGNGISMTTPFTSSTSLSTNTPYQLASTWDPATGNLTIMVNDLFTETFDTGITSAEYAYDQWDVHIGSHYAQNNFFHGKLSGMSVYNRPLNESEIEQAFANDNYAGSNGLLAYYPMAEGNGSTLYDASGNNFHAEQVNGDELTTWGQTQNGTHYNFEYGYNALENRNEDSEDLTTSNWGKVTAPGQTATTITGTNTINFGLANSTAWLDYPIVYQSPGAGANPHLHIQPGETLYTTFTLSGNPGETAGIYCSSEFDSTPGTYTVTLNATPTDYECPRTVVSAPETWFNYGVYRQPIHTATTVTLHKIHTRMNNNAAYVKTQGEGMIVDASVPALITNPSIDALGNSINGTHFITNLDSDLTAPYKAVSLNTREQDLTAFVRFSTSAVQEQIIFEKGEEDDGYKFFLDSSGRLNFSQNGDIGFNAINSAASFNDGEIHNAFVTIDHTANGISLYVDNNLAANNTFAEVDFAPVGNIAIAGKDENNLDNFDGRIYQVRFFNSLMDSNGISAIENNYDFDDFFYDVDGAPPQPADDANSFMWGGQ